MSDFTPANLAERLAAGAVFLVDVREPREFAETRIKGAFNFPLSTFDPSALPHDPAREVVLHCGTGKRSAMALAACEKAGVKVGGHLAGGLEAWRVAGLTSLAIDPSTGELKEV